MFQNDFTDTIRYILKGRNEFFESKAVSSPFKGAEYVKDEDLTICLTGFNEPFANGVWEHFPTSLEAQKIEKTLDSVVHKKLPFFWWESPIPYGKDLSHSGKKKISSTGELLTQRGMLFGGMLTGIYAPLTAPLPSHKVPSNINFKQAHSIEEFEEFSTLICKTFGVSQENYKPFMEFCLPPFEKGSERHYLAYDGVNPIAGVTLSMGKEAAGIWNFATQSDYRCQGIGSELIRTAMKDAKKMGYHSVMAILLADAMSELWRKLNFQEICKFPYYISVR